MLPIKTQPPITQVNFYLADGSLSKISIQDIKSSIKELKSIPLGKVLSSGGAGLVYENKENPDFVYKELFSSPDDEFLKMSVIPECYLFKLYYGEEASCIVQCNNKTYIKMLKIPGKTLLEIGRENLPDNKEQLLLEMLGRLASIGIYHTDLNSANILYDHSSNAFHPIDFTILETQYGYLTNEERNSRMKELVSFKQLKERLFD